jgi:hydrogenase nickel incorporation protein HypB
MCATCGCTPSGVATLVGARNHPHETGHAHDHGHDHAHDHVHDVIDTTDPQTIALERAVLAQNDALAAANRRWLEARRIVALNLMSSPGAGKTSLLERTIHDLRTDVPLLVIEGDQATENDAARIRAAGGRAVQVNTGTGCHLEAGIIRRALDVLEPVDDSVVMIENVGNLVCPALFDLGERAKVALLSVAEGDDKPAKYPYLFAAADLFIITKTDLLPYVDFDVEACIAHARAVRPGLDVIALSVRTGDNMTAWYRWIRGARAVPV